MIFKDFNDRELRSFRLKHFLKNFKNFIETKDSFGFFFMAESLAPMERIKLRQELGLFNLKVNLISNKIIKLLFKQKNQDWKSIINLLQGGVVFIKGSSQEMFKDALIKKFLKHSNFIPRFLYWNNSFFRVNALQKYVETSSIKKDIRNNIMMVLSGVLKKIFWQLYFLKNIKK